MERDQSTGTFYALLSAFFLGFTGILIRRISLEFALPALVLATWRNILTSAVLLLYLRLRTGVVPLPRKENLRFYCGYALLLTGFNLLWTVSVILNGATIATVLVYTSTLFTILLDRVLNDRRVEAVSVVAALLSLFGCLLLTGALTAPTTTPGGVSSPSTHTPGFNGALVGISSGMAFALYSSFGGRASDGGRNSWVSLAHVFGISGLGMAVVTILLAPFGVSTAGPLLQLRGEVRGWLLLLILAAGPTLLGYGFYTAALGKLPSSVVNLLATTEPLFTAVIAFFYLQERLDGSQLLGGAATLLAVVLVRVGRLRLRTA